MKHKFIEYGGIRHIQIIIDESGACQGHKDDWIKLDELNKLLDLGEDTVHPLPDKLVVNEDPGDYLERINKRDIPGFGKFLNVTVNKISGINIIPISAQLILGKGGQWITTWGSPVMPYLYILDVTVEAPK